MDGRLDKALIAVSVGVIVLLLILILRRWFRPGTRQTSVISDAQRSQSMQNGIARLHHREENPAGGDGSGKGNYHVYRPGVSSKKPFFNWADHPSLITDAVENGWSQFAFTNFISSVSVKSARSLRVLGACAGAGAATGDQGNGIDVEFGWEVCEGSADFMQKIKLNPGLKKVTSGFNSSSGAVSVIRTALPLPGPQVGKSSFPQEAYFELTILPRNQRIHDQSVGEEEEKREGEKIKLIGEDFNSKLNGANSNRASSSESQSRNTVEETKIRGRNEAFMSVGLTGGGSVPLKIPGSYPGSIGFSSNGSVYLDGIKLMLDSEKDDWLRAGTVIGCGYNPSQKKVFFTADAQLVHEIYCKSEEFGSPLYPTLAANTEITVLANLGQCPFKYTPANRQRTPNPCFIRPVLDNSQSFSYEDSRELFSMGRIDSQWLLRIATRSNNNTVNSLKSLEYDQESDGDLFEIVLDGTGRSPYSSAATPLQ